MRILTALSFLALLIPGSILAQAVSVTEELSDKEGLSANGVNADGETLTLPDIDFQQVDLANAKRQMYDESAHFAAQIPVRISPLDLGFRYGRWDSIISENVADIARWRLRLKSRGALSLSLAFSRFKMPEGGELRISSADGREQIGPFTHKDNKAHGQLWTPPLLTDEIVLDLRIPADLPDDFDLLLTRVHHGYSGFGEALPLSGSCQQDIACFDDPVWHDVARSVALISIEGVRFCSGFMMNNTNLDGKPYFMTAHHCGVTEKNAASVVVMWSYESSFCRDEPEELTQEPSIRPSRRFQTGATLRAVYEPTDMTLMELDNLPREEWNIHYAGWDRSGMEPEGVTAIHHPNTDMKRLSHDQNRAKATFFRYDAGATNGDHLRIGSWEVGSTEGGSSGSPLFNQNQQVIGQLHGGYAQCGEKEADWFGRLALSWSGSGKIGGRLSDWLDPFGTDSKILEGLNTSELP